MTKLEIYNKITEWFKTHEPAYENETCVYQTSDGRRCAVGCLLTDDDIVALDGMNGSIHVMLKSHKNIFQKLIPEDGDVVYLEAMQMAHDSFASSNLSTQVHTEHGTIDFKGKTLQERFDLVAQHFGVIQCNQIQKSENSS